MNTPCLHFEFNEAWILDPEADKNIQNEAIMTNPAKTISAVKSHKEKYPNGNIKLTWTAGIGDDGRYLLHGAEHWVYEDGTKQYESMYALGEKIGTEIYYRPDGSKVWEWAHFADGSGKWIQYWDNGNKKAESNWYRSHIHGTANIWGRTGKLLKTKTWPDLDSLINDIGY